MFGTPVILALLKFVEWDETREGSSLEAGFFWLFVGGLVMSGGMGLGWITSQESCFRNSSGESLLNVSGPCQ